MGAQLPPPLTCHVGAWKEQRTNGKKTGCLRCPHSINLAPQKQGYKKERDGKDQIELYSLPTPGPGIGLSSGGELALRVAGTKQGRQEGFTEVPQGLQRLSGCLEGQEAGLESEASRCSGGVHWES